MGVHEAENVAPREHAIAAEREAIIAALDQARWHIALGSLLGAVAAAVLLLLGLYSERMGAAMAMLVGIPMLLLYLLAIPAYLRWSAAAVLTLLHGAIILTAVSYLLLLADALFGSQAERLLAEELPLVLIYLPILLVFIYTYLPTHRAHLYTSIHAAVSLLMLLLYLLLYPAALRSPAWYWLLGSVAVVTPMCIMLLKLQAELHAEHRRALSRSEARITDRSARLQRAQGMDELAPSMNRSGLQRALADTLADEPRTTIAFLEIERYEHLRLRLGRSRLREWLAWLTRQLHEAFGEAVCWGQWRPGQFVLWHPSMSAELFASNLQFLAELLQRSAEPAGAAVEFRIGRASGDGSDPDAVPTSAEALVEQAEYAAWPERRAGSEA